MHITTLLCDLDGVLTRTAKLHAKTWKILFDEFLKKHAEQNNEEFQEFNTATDYPKYVDGIPRLDGIRSFLKSRNIFIPEGSSNDPNTSITVNGLGKQKNLLFNKLLKKEGVETFSSSIEVLKKWKKSGLKLAVVSSSKNCKQILEASGIANLFDVIVDGITREEKNLRGKPYPDTFLYACKLLNARPEETAVAEDAASGIEAAVKGNFGLTIGIKNENNFNLLKQAKADTIVNNLSELVYKGNIFQSQ
ncbi:MAG: HAD-IA family hydrolase [Sporocytophaga sp.]|nr:HAD-IA family hydrolase [Sporocytophaga sp.]